MCTLSYLRVLIFTQKAHMLDILRIFLNYTCHEATALQKRLPVPLYILSA